jgi:hypothetical protein
MTEITRPIIGLFPTLHPQIDEHLQILLCENLTRPSFIDLGFWFAVGQ